MEYNKSGYYLHSLVGMPCNLLILAGNRYVYIYVCVCVT